MPGTRPLLERRPVALETAGPAREAELGAGLSHRPCGDGPAPGAEVRLRRGRRSCRRPLQPPSGLRPLLKPVQRLAALLSLLPPGSLSAMASALSYVSKFKSFVILFLTPILLLPLIILMPAKVSCVSGQPGGFRDH